MIVRSSRRAIYLSLLLAQTLGVLIECGMVAEKPAIRQTPSRSMVKVGGAANFPGCKLLLRRTHLLRDSPPIPCSPFPKSQKPSPAGRFSKMPPSR